MSMDLTHTPTLQYIPSSVTYYAVVVPRDAWGRPLNSENEVAPLVDRYLYNGHQIQRCDLDLSGEFDKENWIVLVAYEHLGSKGNAEAAVQYQRDRLLSGGLRSEVLATLSRQA